MPGAGRPAPPAAAAVDLDAVVRDRAPLRRQELEGKIRVAGNLDVTGPRDAVLEHLPRRHPQTLQTWATSPEYRDGWRLEHAAGNRQGLHTAITRVQQVNRELDCSLETETEQLVKELLNDAGSGARKTL
ncbi:hypothetical protein [Streptomyces flaveolus]|uniref:hypothetical protein n=1 Tax=Streptomyces flaveolus TaxID=67297 RepID=UPI003332147F